MVHAAHLGGEEALGRDDFQPAAGQRDRLGGLHAGVAAVVVEQQHVLADLGVARQDVPARRDELVAGLEEFGVGQAAAGDDDDVGLLGEHRLGIGQDVAAQGDAEGLAARHAPVDDADHLGTAPGARRQPDLAAGFVGGLEQRPPRGHARRRRVPLRARPDRRRRSTTLRCGAGGARHLVRQRRFAAGGRVVDAQRLAVFVDAVQAVGGADAGPDLVLAALFDLEHDVRIGDVRTRHAHHVELARGDGVARGGHVGDARAMEDRKARRRAHLAGKVEVRRRRHALDRDHFRQRRVGVDVAADDVEKIDLAVVDQCLRNAHALFARQALVPVLIGDQADADDELGADGLADRVQHAAREAQAVVDRAAVFVVAVVGRRRPEGIEQVAIGFELDAVEPRGLHALRGAGVVGTDAVEVPVFGLLGKTAVRRLADRRGCEHRQPVAGVPARAPPEVGELDHHRGAMLVAVVGQAFQPRHDLVAVGMQVAEGGRRIGRNDRRAGGHRQRHAALGALDVVEAVAVLGQAVFRVRRLVRGQHDAVLQPQVLQLERLQQRIVLHRPGWTARQAAFNERDSLIKPLKIA